MKREELKSLLQNAYTQEKWIKTLQFLSGSKNLLTISLEPKAVEIRSTKAKEIVSEIVQLGSLKTTDGITLPIFDVTLQDGIKIEYNRVGVNDLLKNHILKDAIKGAIVTFHYDKKYNKDEWRFSFISKFGSDYFAEAESIETNPKKYTYIFGTTEEHRTALERLYNLEQSRFRLEDFFEAFNVEPVSNNFFKEYKNFYKDFVHDLNTNPASRAVFENKNLSDDEVEKKISNFVKRLLGRLVFLYFLQKKHWLGATNKNYDDGDTNFLFNLFNFNDDSKDNFYQKWLSKLFFNALNTPNRTNDSFELPDGKSVWIPFLNGGLFEEQQEPEKHRKIQFPPTLFELLFKFFNSYNFTIYENSPEDHTIAVDPEMLGNIFENLLEDNKDKGAFYTPKEIVHYMTQESLIEYLNSNLTQSRIEVGDLIKNHNYEPFKQDLKKIDKLIDKVKICDPAIGSGAFPMGLLQEIYTLKSILHFALDKKTEDWKPAEIKKNIIQNSIYGVDLEPGAVDIARLRFWLSLVVDEPIPQPLPNLDYKIMQGNSVVESFNSIDLSKVAYGYETKITELNRDLFGNVKEEQLNITFGKADISNTIQEKTEKYFTASVIEKTKLKQDINNLVNEFIEYNIELKENQIDRFILQIETENKDVDKRTKTQERKYAEWLTTKENLLESRKRLKEISKTDEKPYFLWHLFFADVFKNGGFDIVIGNPPYIKEATNKNAFNEFRNTEYYQGKMDLWYGFACKGIDWLKDGGIQCYIAQNNWITSSGSSKLRNKIVTETEMLSFIDFGNYKVFQNAGIQTMIYVVKKTTPREKYTTNYARLLVDNIDKTFLDYFLQSNATTTHENFEKLNFKFIPALYINGYITFANDINDSILKKIQNVEHIKLEHKEVASGIDISQDSLNKKSVKKLGDGFKIGDGVFVLNKIELEELSLNEKELEIIKPFFTTKQLTRFYAKPENEHWVIYTDSTFKNPTKIESYPNLKKHLDRFIDVITSDNRPYGLHRAREEKFFKSEKVLALRKCIGRPVFTYVNFDTYVSRPFLLIQTERLNHKFLTGLLNSKLVAFWLKSKGKMQGHNYQVDKEPVLEIPIINTDKQHIIAILVDYILLVHQSKQAELIKYIGNDLIIHSIEEVINQVVYELYFTDEDEIQELKILSYLEDLKPISTKYNEADNQIVIDFYHWLNEQRNPIRNVLLKANIVSKNIIGIINSTVS
jgi:adenine-specific DNA-methyltransferase